MENFMGKIKEEIDKRLEEMRRQREEREEDEKEEKG